eukprot:4999016-Ditylum_brightwellii.AAC.1
MKTELQMPSTLIHFICKWGAMKGLFSDNAKAQTSMAIKDILCQYNNDNMQSEPHNQNQNTAERYIAMTNLANEQLGWLKPISVAFGYTPN